MRNPVSTRIVPLPDSATTTFLPMGCRLGFSGCADSDAGISPSVTSTQAGIRMACTAPTTQMSAVNHSAPDEPKICSTSAATAPNAAPPTRPNVVSRALVLASVMSGGTTLGRDRRLEHGERLGQHHLRERGRIEQPAVEVRGHHEARERLPDRRDAHGEPPAALDPVQHRPDDRRDQRERRDGDQQVERDLALGRVGARGGEEQRVGERDGHGRVARVVEHRRVGERGEPGLVGAVGVHGAPERGGRVAGELLAADRGDAGDGQLLREAGPGRRAAGRRDGGRLRSLLRAGGCRPGAPGGLGRVAVGAVGLRRAAVVVVVHRPRRRHGRQLAARRRHVAPVPARWRRRASLRRLLLFPRTGRVLRRSSCG